ncbi:uncharacterized protein PG998_000747 [Apiospora kogelbergensis]|uniref:uncharacterized protein n=1 Tax=Apiospora kogelbergensis TaxID=1337665 RepID=UPI00312DB7ED
MCLSSPRSSAALVTARLFEYELAQLPRASSSSRQINWEKLAAKTGFQDAAAAKVYYGVLSTLEDSNTARTRDPIYTASKRVKIEASGYSNRLEEDET